jgi:RNA polymerase sigma factor (sigma-70 family)
MIAVRDEVLLERWIARRDAEAFNEIVTRHAALVYGICKRLLRNDADAEDTTQNCFLKLARAASPPRNSLPGWLHATATRAALDSLRAGSRRALRERTFAMDRARESAGRQILDELKEHIDECIARLPDDLREVIVLHFLERRTQEAVAADLRVSRQTVTYRIAKGVERLRFLLGKRTFAVTGASLSAFLGSSMVEAAPPSVLASLGRVALAGPSIPASVESAAPILIAAKIGATIMAKKLVLSGLAAAALITLLGITILRAPVATRKDGAAGSGVAGLLSVETPALGIASAPRQDAVAPAVEEHDAAGAVQAPPAFAGKVFDSEGRPVSGALVIAAAPVEDRLEKLAEAASDASGAFRLAAAVRPDIAIYGYRIGVGLGAAAGEALDLQVVLEPLAELDGRLYDRETGQGIAGVRISIRSSSSSPGVDPEILRLHADAARLFPDLMPERLAAVSDEDGRFGFAGLGPVRYRLAFDPASSEYVLPGYRREDYEPEVRLEPGERRSGMDYALEKGGSISGTVFGPGAALPGAQVEVLASYLTVSRRVAWCDRDGAYRFTGLLPGSTYSIAASHEGFPPGESSTVGMPSAESIEGADVHLSWGHAASGRVVDELGRPLPGIPVILSTVPASDRRPIVYPEQVTAEDGAFSSKSVAPGKHSLQARAPSDRIAEPLAFTMPADRDLADLELVLRQKAAGYISGHVVDPDGRPVAGFPVNAMLGTKTVSRAATDEDGAFRLEGLGDAGSYIITGYSGEHWSSRQAGVALNTTDVTIVAMKRGRIVGHVIDEATRKPIEHFEVRAVFIRTEPAGENRFHSKWIPCDSPAGQFLFDGAEPVDCEVQVRAEGYIETKSARFAIPPGGAADEVVVALSRGASVKGTVLDDEGQPVAGALVRAHQHDDFFPGLLEEGRPSYAPKGIWKLTMSGADGAFEVSGLAPEDTIHLVAWKEGYGPAVRPGITVGRRGSAVTIALSRAAALIIAARFEPQTSERYEIHLYSREEKPWRGAFRTSVEIEKPGTVEIPGLPAGSHRLVLWAVAPEGDDPGKFAHRLVGEQRLELSPGERHRTALDLDRLPEKFGSVLVKVTGRTDYDAVRLYIVSADDPEEPYAFAPARPGPQGRVRFSGLPPGKYVVIGGSATIQSQPTAELPVELAERQHLEVELALE